MHVDVNFKVTSYDLHLEDISDLLFFQWLRLQSKLKPLNSNPPTILEIQEKAAI